MINCAHPSHFERVLGTLGERRARLRGVRANASRRSHAELDSATELDAGNPQELGARLPAVEVGAAESLRHRRLLRHGPSARGGHELGARRCTLAARSGSPRRRSRRRGLAC